MTRHPEPPLDPAVYRDPDELRPASTVSSGSIASAASSRSRGFVLRGKADYFDESCSAGRIGTILGVAVLESLLFGLLLLIPMIAVMLGTTHPSSNQAPGDFVRGSLFIALLYGTWVTLDATFRVLPLVIRRAWHMTKTPLPNALRTTLAGWKAARGHVAASVFGLIALLLFDTLMYRGTALIQAVTPLATETLHGLSRHAEWMERALLCLCALALVLLITRFVMQKVTAAFHREALAARIRASNLQFRVLTRLFRQTDLTTLDARRSIARDTARDLLRSDDDEAIEMARDTVGVRLTSESRVRQVAASLWGAVCPHTRDYLVMDDLRAFFAAEDASVAFSVFDRRRVGIVNAGDWTDALLAIWRDRENLRTSVQMSGRTLAAFETILRGSLLTVWLVSTLWLFNPRGYAWLASTAGLFLTFGLLLRDSCKRVFESFIFVLIEHPFDVGDRVIVDKTRYVVLLVEVLTTVLQRDSDHAIAYIPNHILATKYIYNEARSGIAVDSMLVTLAASTPLSLLAKLQARLHVFLQETAPHYTGSVAIIPVEMEHGRGRMNVRIESRFSDPAGELEQDARIARKESVSLQVQTLLQELGIARG